MSKLEDQRKAFYAEVVSYLKAHPYATYAQVAKHFDLTECQCRNIGRAHGLKRPAGRRSGTGYFDHLGKK